MTSLVTVIVPAYNAERYIGEALDSILAQQVDEAKILVVDDGSTDGTRHLVRRYGPRVNYVHQRNSGNPAIARNLGLSIAETRYVAFLDSDDVWLPNHLSTSLNLLEAHDDVAMTFANYLPFIDGQQGTQTEPDYFSREHINELLQSAPAQPTDKALRFDLPITTQIVHSNFIRTSSVVARTEILRSAGSFPTNVFYAEDLGLWIRLCLQGHRFAALLEPGMRYRIRGDSISHDPRNMPELIAFWRSFMTEPHPAELDEIASLKIFSNACSLGYYHRARGNAVQSLRYYALAIRYAPWNRRLGPLLGMAKVGPSLIRRRLNRPTGAPTP